VVTLGVHAAVGSHTVAAAGVVATVVILDFKQALHAWLLKMLATLVIGTQRSAPRLAIVTAVAIAGGAATRLALCALG